MLTDLQIAILKQKAVEGVVPVAEYLKVEWDKDDPDENRYYAVSAYHETPPFASIGFVVEPRLLGDPFANMEINPDLRTQTIDLTFDDIDRTLRARFKQFDSGVRCEIFRYFPDVNAHESLWFGQLQAPERLGWKVLQTVATNGYRAREAKLPKRTCPRECPFSFGGAVTEEALQTNGCPYNRHVGGSLGNLNSGDPYTTCPKDEAGCTARFGHLRFFGGFKPDAAAVVTDGNTGYLAHSKGNASALRNSIRAIYGTKTVRGLQQLFGRREVNASTPAHGFIAGVWMIGEGPIESVSNFKIAEKLIEAMHWNPRLGSLGQAALSQYAPDISNLSGTALVMGRYGWVDALATDPMGLPTEIGVRGLRNVPVLQNTGPGYGLRGEYFDGVDWTSSVAVRIDNQINFPSSFSAPIQGLGNKNFSIRWTGFITFEHSENYTISVGHDDGVKVIIDGSTIINQLGALGTHTGNFSATAGTPYPIQIDFFQSNTAGVHHWYCQMSWQSTSQTLQIVPYTAFTNGGGEGLVRQFSNDRIYCLLDMMNNSKLGLSNPFSRFNLERWVETATWGRQPVRFSYTNADGETRTYDHTRTQFDCIVEGRPIAEVLIDVCRSGRMTVPFQHQGKYEILPYRAFTQAELDAAPVFTDTGENQNIYWSNGAPSIEIFQTPNDKIINEYKVVFEDGQFGDNARPITVDDPEQKRLAGRVLGEDALTDIPSEVAAFGVRNLNEAIKLGYGWLRFGQFDEGGTQNNGRLTMLVKMASTLGIKRHDPIKVVSQILTEEGAPRLPDDSVMEYFRVSRIVRVNQNTYAIEAQVYNHAAYIAFETLQTVNAPTPGDPPPFPSPDPPMPPDDPLPPDDPRPPLDLPIINSVSYDADKGFLIVDVS